jgi:dCTP deaminase
LATIPDFRIRELARNQGLIEPYNPEQLNPASYDVTLGSKIKVETRNGWQDVDISTVEFLLAPGAFVLAYTEEVVRIPNWLESTFQLKSSRGREGYEHALAGYIDPGFTGQVTLELTNLNRYHWLPLSAGMRIGQLRFMKMDEVPHRPYSLTGRYMNDRGAVTSKG